MSAFRTTLTALVATLTVSCGGGPEVSPAPPLERDGSPTLAIAPRSGLPGSAVQLDARGFPAASEVVIGFGPPQSEYEVIRRATTDASGGLTVEVAVPDWAESGRSYVWVVADPSTRPRAISDRFEVDGRGG